MLGLYIYNHNKIINKDINNKIINIYGYIKVGGVNK